MYININSQFSFSVPLKFSLNICLQIQSTHINFKPPNELFFLIQLTVTSWGGTNAPFLLPPSALASFPTFPYRNLLCVRYGNAKLCNYSVEQQREKKK